LSEGTACIRPAGQAEHTFTGSAWPDDDQGRVLFVTTRTHQSNLELGALPSAVACARLHAKQVAWEWGLDTLAETIELVVSELATNAIKAAVTYHDADRVLGMPVIWLRLTGGDGQVLVEVWDSNPEPPVRAEADLTMENGRGLLLVDAVSTNWGYYSVEQDIMPGELSAPTADWGPGEHYEISGQRDPGSDGKVVWALIRAA